MHFSATQLLSPLKELHSDLHPSAVFVQNHCNKGWGTEAQCHTKMFTSLQRLRLRLPYRTSKQAGSGAWGETLHLCVTFTHSFSSPRHCSSPLDNLYQVHQWNKTGSAFHRCCKRKTRGQNTTREVEGNRSVSDVTTERVCHLFTLQSKMRSWEATPAIMDVTHHYPQYFLFTKTSSSSQNNLIF